MVVSVLAVPGNGGGAFRFAAALPHLPDDVVLHPVTLPGFDGVAPRDDVRTAADWGDLVADAVAALPRPRVLLGHGVGGALAVEALQGRAGLVDGLLLHAPVGASLDTRLLPKVVRLPGVSAVLRRGLASRAARPLVRRRVLDPGVPDELVARFQAGYAGCAAFDDFWDLLTAGWWDALEPLDVPALLLWGAGDGVLGADQVDGWRRLLPRGDVEVVDRWGHWPMLAAPADWADVVARRSRALAAA